MFKNKYKQKYEEQERIKKILFLIYPKLWFMYNDIERLLKQNYPLKNIVILMKDKYNVQSKTNWQRRNWNNPRGWL